MPESTLIVLLLVLLFAIVLAAIAFVLRTLQSIQHTLATIPSAQLASGLNSAHSEQARLAQELGRTAIGALQNAQHSVDAAVRTFASQAAVRAESDAQELLERLTERDRPPRIGTQWSASSSEKSPRRPRSWRSTWIGADAHRRRRRLA